MTAESPSEPDEFMAQIDAEACARLLAATDFGRLALVHEGRPVIVVLNHLVVGSDVLFRTGEHALAARLTAGGQEVYAAFEVDSAFPVGHSGWSVIADGRLGRESDEHRTQTARTRIDAWAEGDRDAVLRLQIDELTGRRVGRD